MMISLALCLLLTGPNGPVPTRPSSPISSVPSLPVGEESIGSFGAKVTLSRSWSRQEFTPDLGPDQFSKGRGAREIAMAITEIEGLFLTEGDVRSIIDVSRDEMELAMGRSAEVGRTRIETRGDMLIASTSISGKANGLEIEFQIEVVARPGLAYQFIVWGGKSRSNAIAAARREVVDSFEVPPADSEWSKSTRPRTYTRVVDGRRISIGDPLGILRDVTGEMGGTLTLMSADLRLIYLIDVHRDSYTSDEVLDDVEEYLELVWKTVTRLRRSARSVCGMDGTVSAMLVTDGGEDVFVESIALELDAGTFLEIRITSDGDDGAHRTFRNELLGALSVVETERIDAFPEPRDDASRGYDPGQAPGVAALLDGSVTLGEFSGYSARAELVGDGLVLASGSEILRFRASKSEAETLYSGFQPSWTGYGSGQDTATTRAGTHVVEDEQLVRIASGTREELGAPALAVTAVSKDRLVLLEAVDASPPLGFGAENVRVARVVLRDERGRATVLSVGDMRSPQNIIGSGSQVFVSARYGYDMSPVRAIAIDVDRPGTIVELGSWTFVSQPVEASDGWVVHGAPEGGSRGTWHVRPDGSRSLLYGGTTPSVFGMSDAHLFVSGVHPYASTGLSQVHAIARAHLASVGPGVAPWSETDLVTIAGAAFEGVDSTLPTGTLLTREILDGLLERADAASVEQYGQPLPVHPAAVDALVDAHASSRTLDDRGRALLAALVARALIERGVRWVDPSPVAPIGFDPNLSFDENPVAVGIHARCAVVLNGSFQTETYAPTTTTLTSARGRTILVGDDARTLREALRAESSAIEDIDFGTVPLRTLDALCDERSRNAGLRAEFYRWLAGTGRHRIAGAIARRFAVRSDGSAEDHAAAIGARVELEEDSALLVRDLRSAIGSFPNQAVLYVLLGRTYERRSETDDLIRARACYQEVIDSHGYGTIAELAQKGIEELDAR